MCYVKEKKCLSEEKKGFRIQDPGFGHRDQKMEKESLRATDPVLGTGLSMEETGL